MNRSVMTRIQHWYARSLINRVGLSMQLLLLVFFSVIGGVAFISLFEEAHSRIQARLEQSSLLHARLLEETINRTFAELATTSSLPFFDEALQAKDEQRLGHYLQALQQTSSDLSSLFVLDKAGGWVYGSDAPREWVEALNGYQSGSPSIKYLLNADEPYIGFAFPVLDKKTANLHGALVGKIKISNLLSRVIEKNKGIMADLLIEVRDVSGRVLYPRINPAATEMLNTSRRLEGSLAAHGVELSVLVSTPVRSVYVPLFPRLLMLCAVAIVLLIIGFFLVRQLAIQKIEPIARMAHRAHEIANAGPGGLVTLSIQGEDEIGEMGKAFNAMVHSLKASYQQLELRVSQRTDALVKAESRLSEVLANTDDLIFSAAGDWHCFYYVSPVVESIFGRPAQAFIQDPGLFERLVVEEDREMLAAGRQSLADLGHVELRYRVCHANGEVRWVLDRSHLVGAHGGQETRVSGMLRDITSTVEAEGLLHLRERALESASCGVVISDMRQPGQPIVYANQGFEYITGYSAEEVIGKNCSFLQAGESQQEAVDLIRDAVSRGKPTQVIIRNYKKNGEMFWNDLRISPLTDEHGHVTHFIGIQNDITPTISATQALVESERRFSLTIDALDEGLWDWNLQENTMYTSPSWSHVLGLDPLLAGSTLDYVMAQVPEEWRTRVSRELEHHLNGTNNSFYLEHQMHHQTLGVIWVANRGRVVERDDDGRPMRMVGTIVDITARYEASEQIMNLMSKLDVIFTLSPDAFVYFDESGQLSYVNPAFETLTGITAGEIARVSPSVFRSRLEEIADPRQTFPSLADSAGQSELLYLSRPEHRVLLVTCRGGSVGTPAVAYMRDVTRETEVDRMKSEFLTTAAHELRTPMASIMGFSELLMMRHFDEAKMQQMLGTIHRQARRLTDMINELLDLARIEARAGKDFKISANSLQAVMKEAVAALNVDGDRGRMKMIWSLDCDLSVQIDPAKFQQALINVLSNAYKYSPNGGEIDISVKVLEQPTRKVGIVVRDHGIGMTLEQTKRVFERFFRADPSGNIPGTGLGMSLVREIMQAMSGDVEVSSVFGEGTEVTLWLPLPMQTYLAAA